MAPKGGYLCHSMSNFCKGGGDIYAIAVSNLRKGGGGIYAIAVSNLLEGGYLYHSSDQYIHISSFLKLSNFSEDLPH